MTYPDTDALLRWAEVDLGALQHNAEQIRALLAPQTRLMAMVKSNGYGHGLLLAAEGAVRGGASWLGVYHAGEALALRAAGFHLPILVVGVTRSAALAPLIEAGIDISVSDPSELHAIAEAAQSSGARARVHLKIDTGLNRIGVQPERVSDVVTALRAVPRRVDVVGIFTHFADADAADLAFTREQQRRFMTVVDAVRPVAPDALLHCAGSAAMLRGPEYHLDLVRLGIALYGYAPPHTDPPPLRIAMSVFTRLVQVKTVRVGDTVGYGRTWKAPAARRIATAALGYGQGLPRFLSNRGSMVIHGVRCPVVGIVSMDQVGVDVSSLDAVSVGDAAMFIGMRDGVRAGADEVAALGATIPHEVICSISQTVPRIPTGGGQTGGG